MYSKQNKYLLHVDKDESDQSESQESSKNTSEKKQYEQTLDKKKNFLFVTFCDTFHFS